MFEETNYIFDLNSKEGRLKGMVFCLLNRSEHFFYFYVFDTYDFFFNFREKSITYLIIL